MNFFRKFYFRRFADKEEAQGETDLLTLLDLQRSDAFKESRRASVFHRELANYQRWKSQPRRCGSDCCCGTL